MSEYRPLFPLTLSTLILTSALYLILTLGIRRWKWADISESQNAYFDPFIQIPMRETLLLLFLPY